MTRKPIAPVDRLRALIRRHKLTRPQVAELAGVTLKTVESWLASEGSASRRVMPQRAIDLIELRLAAASPPKKKTRE